MIGICDGGYKSSDGIAYGSFKVLNSSGEIMIHRQLVFNVNTNNTAEYMALIALLKWCLDNNILNIDIICDSLLLVNQITNRWQCKDSKLRSLLSVVNNLINKFDTFNISHVSNITIKSILGH